MISITSTSQCNRWTGTHQSVHLIRLFSLDLKIERESHKKYFHTNGTVRKSFEMNVRNCEWMGRGEAKYRRTNVDMHIHTATLEYIRASKVEKASCEHHSMEKKKCEIMLKYLGREKHNSVSKRRPRFVRIEYLGIISHSTAYTNRNGNSEKDRERERARFSSEKQSNTWI